MMTPVATQGADRLARVGLLGTYTLLARRAARARLLPRGEAGGPCAFRSEAFGWRARLPAGWVRQSIETLNVGGRGQILLQDLEVLTPEGVLLRIGSAIEPDLPADVAIDELVRVLGAQAGGRIVACEPRDDAAICRDLTIFGDERTLAVARIAVVGRRVLCADAWLDASDPEPAAGDEVVRDFFDRLALLDEDEATEGRPSGTYRSTRRG